MAGSGTDHDKFASQVANGDLWWGGHCDVWADIKYFQIDRQSLHLQGKDVRNRSGIEFIVHEWFTVRDGK